MTIIDQLKIDWDSSDFYNYTDLNRVENACVFISDRIFELYKHKINLPVTSTNRTIKTIEFADDLNRIEKNIKQILDYLHNPKGTIEPKTNWKPNQSFSFSDANRLEQNLYYAHKHFQANAWAIPYTGQYTLTTEKGVL